MCEQTSFWNVRSLLFLVFVSVILMGASGCTVLDVLRDTDRYYSYKPSMSERALHQGMSEQFRLNCPVPLKANNPGQYDETNKAIYKCHEITMEIFGGDKVPDIKTGKDGLVLVNVAKYNFAVPIPVKNLRITDASIYEFSSEIKEVLLKRNTAARRARLFSGTLQVLTAAAGAALVAFNGPAEIVAGLAGASAVIPNLQMIFQAGERAAAYTQGVKLINDAETHYINKIGGVGNVNNTDLTQYGAEFHARVVSALVLVEEAIEQTIPSIETLEKASGKYFIDLSSDQLTFGSKGDESVAIAVTSGGPITTAYSINQNIAQVKEFDKEKVTIQSVKNDSKVDAKTTVIIANAQGRLAKVDVTVSAKPSAGTTEQGINYLPKNLEFYDDQEGLLGFDKSLDGIRVVSSDPKVLAIAGINSKTIKLNAKVNNTSTITKENVAELVKLYEKVVFEVNDNKPRLSIKTSVLLLDSKGMLLASAPVTIHKELVNIDWSIPNMYKYSTPEETTFTFNGEHIIYCNSDNEAIKVDCNNGKVKVAATSVTKDKDYQAKITVVSNNFKYRSTNVIYKALNDKKIIQDEMKSDLDDDKLKYFKINSNFKERILSLKDGANKFIYCKSDNEGIDCICSGSNATISMKKEATAKITFVDDKYNFQTIEVAYKDLKQRDILDFRGMKLSNDDSLIFLEDDKKNVVLVEKGDKIIFCESSDPNAKCNISKGSNDATIFSSANEGVATSITVVDSKYNSQIKRVVLAKNSNILNSDGLNVGLDDRNKIIFFEKEINLTLHDSNQNIIFCESSDPNVKCNFSKGSNKATVIPSASKGVATAITVVDSKYNSKAINAVFPTQASILQDKNSDDLTVIKFKKKNESSNVTLKNPGTTIIFCKSSNARDIGVDCVGNQNSATVKSLVENGTVNIIIVDSNNKFQAISANVESTTNKK